MVLSLFPPKSRFGRRPDSRLAFPGCSSRVFLENLWQMKSIDDYVKALGTFVPEFPAYWNSEEALFHFDDESTVMGVFSDFSSLVTERLRTNTLENPESFFAFIESVIEQGGEAATAATTGFLENLPNQTPRTIPPDRLIPYLGPESRHFCRAWDEITGIKTPGL